MLTELKNINVLNDLKKSLSNDLIDLQRNYSSESEYTFPLTSQLDTLMLFEVITYKLKSEYNINTISDSSIFIMVVDLLNYYKGQEKHILQNYPIYLSKNDMTYKHTRNFIMSKRKSLLHIQKTIGQLNTLMLEGNIIDAFGFDNDIIKEEII